MADNVYCCSCGELIVYGTHARLLEIDYTVPEDEHLTIQAICCGSCAMEYEHEERKQVVIMMVSTKLARVRNPEKVYTPNA
jgi:hypothetical protein